MRLAPLWPRVQDDQLAKQRFGWAERRKELTEYQTNEVKRTTSPIRQDSAADSFHQGRSTSDGGTAHTQPVVRGRSALPDGTRSRGLGASDRLSFCLAPQ
jgi:hypothetical protein